MKKGIVMIKCFFNDTIGINKFHIWVYDLDNNLVCDGDTDCLGWYKFSPSCSGIFKIIVCFKGKREVMRNCRNILVCDNKCNKFLFCFSRINFHKLPLITFKLTDRYYKDLPIEKGEMKFSERA
ncbi:MAG: hypothetical protein ACI4WU_04490 [Bacilli bacterium]